MKIKPNWKIRKQKPLPLTHDCDQLLWLSLSITENKKNASVTFKWRFLLRFSTKSWLQRLRRCVNGRGTRWNQEKWEWRCLDSSIRLNSQLGCLQSSKNRSFYSIFGRNRPIVLIDGYNGTVHRGPFRKSLSRSILINGQDEAWWDAL